MLQKVEAIMHNDAATEAALVLLLQKKDIIQYN